MGRLGRSLTIGSAFVFALLSAPAFAQYPPQVDTIPRDNHGASPPGTNSVCILGPNSGAPSPTCPVLKLNGYSFWAFNFNDNRVAMAIAGYDPSGGPIKVWEKGGARYLWQINVNNDSRTVDFVGQSQGKVTMTWDELAAETQPGALSVVNVGASAVTCQFAASCGGSVTVTDTIGAIPVPPGVSGTAQLQTRTFVAAAGSPAAGKTAYEYRVDMTQAVSSGEASCVTDLTIDFGPIAQLNYDGSGNSDAYVITQGGIGTVGVLYATKAGNTVSFTFNQPVCAGATAGTGLSSQFIGIAATQAPAAVTATVGWPGLLGLSVPARAPVH